MYIHTVYIYSSRKAFSKGDASSMVFVHPKSAQRAQRRFHFNLHIKMQYCVKHILWNLTSYTWKILEFNTTILQSLNATWYLLFKKTNLQVVASCVWEYKFLITTRTIEVCMSCTCLREHVKQSLVPVIMGCSRQLVWKSLLGSQFPK